MSKSHTKSVNSEISALLRKERKARNLTQAGLAQRLMKPQSYVAKYEAGEKKLTVGEFILICKGLKTEPSRMIRKVRG